MGFWAPVRELGAGSVSSSSSGPWQGRGWEGPGTGPGTAQMQGPRARRQHLPAPKGSPPPRKQPSQGPPSPQLVSAPLIWPFSDALGIWPLPFLPNSDPEERMFSHSGGGEVAMVRRLPQEGLGEDGDVLSAQAQGRGDVDEG